MLRRLKSGGFNYDLKAASWNEDFGQREPPCTRCDKMRLCSNGCFGFIVHRMKLLVSDRAANWLKITALAFLLAGLTGVVFALWMENGARLFLSMVQSGLAWCF